MARLKMLKPLVRARSPRSVQLAPAVHDPYYSSPKHREWAAAVIARAGGVCQAPGCGRTDSLTADHILERKDGGDDLDLANGQALCPHHNGLKTAAAKRERNNRTVGATHPDWIRPSRIPLTIVCGPPASGKTTLARSRARPGDLVIDLDDIAARLSGRPPHSWSREWLDPALRERNDLLGRLSWRDVPWRNAYLVVSEPTAERREWWTRKLAPRAVVVCEVPASICHDRIDRDPHRASQGGEFIERVDAWWRAYTRRATDQVVHTC